jgi:hypothetical protein
LLPGPAIRKIARACDNGPENPYFQGVFGDFNRLVSVLLLLDHADQHGYVFGQLLITPQLFVNLTDGMQHC